MIRMVWLAPNERQLQNCLEYGMRNTYPMFNSTSIGLSSSTWGILRGGDLTSPSQFAYPISPHWHVNKTETGWLGKRYSYLLNTNWEQIYHLPHCARCMKGSKRGILRRRVDLLFRGIWLNTPFSNFPGSVIYASLHTRPRNKSPLYLTNSLSHSQIIYSQRHYSH